MTTPENKKEKKKKSFKDRFNDNGLGLRIVIGFFCFFFIALFINYREAKVDTLELSAVAGKYIVAQVDFEFPDEEATIILRQKAIRDIGNIYKMDQKQLRQVAFDFESYLLDHKAWKKFVAPTSYDQVSEAASSMEDLLLEIRFADARTIQKMKELNFLVDKYFVYNPSQTSNMRGLYLEYSFWNSTNENSLEKLLSEQVKGIDDKTINFVVSFFIKKQWKLVNDIQEQTNLRHLIEKNIPPIYSKIKAGTKIISQGQDVSSRHVAMLQSMKESIRDSQKRWTLNTILSNVLMALIFVFVSGFYFYIDQPKILKSLQKLSLIACTIVLSLAFAKIIEYVILSNSTHFFEPLRYPLLVPFAAILMSILLNSRVALFISFFLSILMGVVLAVDHSKFLIINLVSCLIVIVASRSLKKRKQVFMVCAKCLLGVIPVIFAFDLNNQSVWTMSLLIDIGHSVVFMLLTAILVVGILPVLESLFNVMTDITLMEYMDPSNELLRRLTLEIPGTYQHSLVLGNLAEAAAQAIHANGLFCRVATLYHDIGKLNNPHYFTENQQSGVNIHQLLTPVESAQVIISHVKDGEILARKYKLPQRFIDIIREHHGTTLVYYFYHKELEMKDNDPTKVDESLFRYLGPKPHSKEAAIIMICDSAEAASRSLENITKEKLQSMVNKVVSDKAEDGQFDECSISFEELRIVKKTIVNMLMLTQHSRVKYPEKKGKEKE